MDAWDACASVDLLSSVSPAHNLLPHRHFLVVQNSRGLVHFQSWPSTWLITARWILRPPSRMPQRRTASWRCPPLFLALNRWGGVWSASLTRCSGPGCSRRTRRKAGRSLSSPASQALERPFGRHVLWHDGCGYHLFMEDTVLRIKPETVCQVGASHAMLQECTAAQALMPSR